MSLSHRRLRMKADDLSNIGSRTRNSQLIEPTAENLMAVFLNEASDFGHFCFLAIVSIGRAWERLNASSESGLKRVFIIAAIEALERQKMRQ